MRIEAVRNKRNDTTAYTLRVGATVVVPDEVLAVDRANIEAAIVGRLVAEVEMKLATPRRLEVERIVF